MVFSKNYLLLVMVIKLNICSVLPYPEYGLCPGDISAYSRCWHSESTSHDVSTDTPCDRLPAG